MIAQIVYRMLKLKFSVAPPTSGTRDAWDAIVMEGGCSKDFIALKGRQEKSLY